MSRPATSPSRREVFASPPNSRSTANSLARLNAWTTSERNIVPDADFKSFNEKNQEAPESHRVQGPREMVKKSKSDPEAFRDGVERLQRCHSGRIGRLGLGRVQAMDLIMCVICR